MITIIPTTTTRHLAKLISPKGVRIVFPRPNKDAKFIFPDGECYTRLPKDEKLTSRVVVLHAGMPNPNEGLVELEMLLAILKEKKIKPEVFFTYMPYSMQDHAFQEGECAAAECLVQKLLEYYKVTKIYTIDAHFHGKDWVKKYPIVNILTKELLMKTAEKEYRGALFVGPDGGSQRRLKIKGLNKKRRNSFEIDHVHDDDFFNSIKGKVVGVMDDLVETGGTLVRFHDKCIEHGAKKLFATITHGVLPSGIERIKANYSKLYLTNTIDRPEANVDISKLITKSLLS